MAAPKAFRYAMPSISTLIQSFIHPSLMNGIGISVAAMTGVVYQGPARLQLENRDDGGANMRWVIEWNNGQRFSDFRNLTGIVRGDVNLSTNKSLWMTYHRPMGRDRVIPAWLSIVFQSSEETEICFGALQALRQIDKLLRENSDST
jgi:hypothetical protein